MTVKSDVKQPNVAVITLKDDEFLKEFDSDVKKPKKSMPKKKVTLEKQVYSMIQFHVLKNYSMSTMQEAFSQSSELRLMLKALDD